MRRDGSGAGTGIRVSVRIPSLLFLLGEELYRQPRAENKFWAGGLRSCHRAATNSSSSSSSTSAPFIDKVLDITVMLQRQVSAVQLCRLLGPFIPASWPMKLRPRSSSTSAVACSQLVLLVTILPALCSLSSSSSSRCSAFLAVCVDQKDSYAVQRSLAGRPHSCRDTEAHPHGPCDHRDFPVSRIRWSMPSFMQVVQVLPSRSPGALVTFLSCCSPTSSSVPCRCAEFDPHVFCSRRP